MNTKTFARLSLLIPIMVWGVCLVFLLVVFGLSEYFETAGETPTLISVVAMFMLFYVIGIIFWLVPYLLIALVLLFLSFKVREKSLKVVYSLSPLAMAVLILLIVSFSTVPSLDSPVRVPDLIPFFQDLLDTGVLFAILALVWGYLCVGIGFGIHKLLRYIGYLKDEIQMEPLHALPAVHP